MFSSFIGVLYMLMYKEYVFDEFIWRAHRQQVVVSIYISALHKDQGKKPYYSKFSTTLSSFSLLYNFRSNSMNLNKFLKSTIHAYHVTLIYNF